MWVFDSSSDKMMTDTEKGIEDVKEWNGSPVVVRLKGLVKRTVIYDDTP